jgi:hypothetical protein
MVDNMILSTTQHESFFEGEKRSVQSFRFSATFIVDRKTYKKRGGSGNYQKNVFGGCSSFYRVTKASTLQNSINRPLHSNNAAIVKHKDTNIHT